MQAQKINPLNTLLIGQQDRTEELNNRLFNRNVPSSLLKPQFEPRPASTKRTKLPIIDESSNQNTDKRKYLDYSLESVFYGGNSKAPVEGYFSNILKENDLRNQTRLLQRNDPLSTYIPDSTSDLYNTIVPSRPDTQPHPLLFTRQQFIQTPTFHNQIGNELFNNHCRTQLRNLE
tara:strand:+ start:229 stop:753 length:525 start_codon:yes stop_codon:yes gene_type:complete